MRTLFAASLLVTVQLCALSAQCEEAGVVSNGARPQLAVGYQVELSVASTYIFRGIAQYKNLYDPSSQNTALVRLDNFGPGSLSVGMWNATALSGYSRQPGTALELDVVAAYAMRVDKHLDVSVGYIGYLFPSHLAGATVDGAHELTLSFAWTNRWLVPSAALFAEVVRQQGVYLALGVSRDLLLLRIVTLTPSLILGLAAYNHYLGGAQSAAPHVNDLSAGLSARVALPRDFYVVGRVGYSLRGTPSALVDPRGDHYGLGDRSSLSGAVAMGYQR